ncbi:MAG TPA: protein-L-isoaspartate(D-aspartate) O-methyltransferase [Candidatus Acidoferrales bacterium]|nr:protein-L-isoaspartate(D-aspartate) O-methyltransferase [Candidatus Acidoferrales bacterium]
MNDKHGPPDTSSPFEDARREMVARQIERRGIRDERVLQAMLSVPRHLFVPEEYVTASYTDEPLPIGERQTISQPFMVAAMAEALLLKGAERVLEIGGGSGYQAAVLSRLAREVIAVEAQTVLASSARERLARLGYENVRVEEADGSMGWPLGAPYDAILVTAAAPSVPPPLVDQLADGGRLVLPVGTAENQELIRIAKSEGRTSQETLFACRFVPLVGRYGWQDRQTQRE